MRLGGGGASRSAGKAPVVYRLKQETGASEDGAPPAPSQAFFWWLN